MSDDLPPPPVPADCDLRGMSGFMLDTEALMASELWALSKGDEFKAATALWCRAWRQIPAASLPNDDAVLRAYSGMSPAAWKRSRDMVLRGFYLCSDGRLYHRTLAEDAARAWECRLAQRDKARKRWGNADNMPRHSHGSAQAVPKQSQGQGQGQGQGFSSLPDGRDSNAPAPDQTPEEDPFDPKVLRKVGPDPVPVGFDDWKLTHPRVFIARTGEDGQPSDWRSLWSRCAPKDPSDPSQVEIWDRMYSSLIPGLREDHWKIRLGDAAKWITEKCNLEA